MTDAADRRSRADRREELIAEVRQKRRYELLERLGERCRHNPDTGESWVPWDDIIEVVDRHG